VCVAFSGSDVKLFVYYAAPLTALVGAVWLALEIVNATNRSLPLPRSHHMGRIPSNFGEPVYTKCT